MLWPHSARNKARLLICCERRFCLVIWYRKNFYEKIRLRNAVRPEYFCLSNALNFVMKRRILTLQCLRTLPYILLPSCVSLLTYIYIFLSLQRTVFSTLLISTFYLPSKHEPSRRGECELRWAPERSISLLRYTHSETQLNEHDILRTLTLLPGRGVFKQRGPAHRGYFLLFRSV
jgi:hypothetical protein